MDIQLSGLDAYTDDIWEKLPEDRYAFKYHRENPLPDNVFDEIGNIFAKNYVQDRFSLYLNHRHFDLEPGESLVESGAIATPWPLRDASDALRANIAAKTWAFLDDKLVPFEFSFPATAEDFKSNHVPSQFIDELGAFLHAHDLTSRFGLTLLPKDMSTESGSLYETTIGRVSVQLPKNDSSPEEIVDVGWKFDALGRKIVRLCVRCCTGHG
ncbi:hypothetical protein K469DRAFT_702879 [Zopfia rhizophila CBS 207.26]|uniref:Uncharacterized protein n=1 Tax=Zopfia rhizophila CBS 207.26 TaxID=1314779 RepID=A0A6A6DAG4_9PEZI|nr:hypothetical protein K469DRAFT_702879 [Zopfia rhizophila CBS 207.26]